MRIGRSTLCRSGSNFRVFHAFQKKAKQGIKTPKKDIDLIRKRLNPIPSMNHPSVDAILINDEIDFPSTATPASCGSGTLKRLLAAPFNAKAKPSMLTM